MRQEREKKILFQPVSQKDHRWGSLKALVTLVEYGDYGCEQSKQAYIFLKANQQRLGNHLCFVFRHFPIRQSHVQAQHAAEAAEAAGAQNRFWEMHDALFAHQQELENGFLVEYADSLGLDTSRFLRDMASHTYAGRVEADIMSGKQSGVEGTPTFFINGVRHDDAWDGETLFTAIKEAADSQEAERTRPLR